MQVAEYLWESAIGFASPEIEEAWRVEIRRRIEEVDSGQVQMIPHEEVMREIHTIVLGE